MKSSYFAALAMILLVLLAMFTASKKHRATELGYQVRDYPDNIASFNPTAENGAKYPVVNITVIDGDTIRGDMLLPFDLILSQQNIRFLGVDTPERKDKSAWLAAKEFTESKIAVESISSAVVWIEPPRKKQRDSFGRVLARVYINPNGDQGFTDLADEIISNGYGKSYEK